MSVELLNQTVEKKEEDNETRMPAIKNNLNENVDVRNKLTKDIKKQIKIVRIEYEEEEEEDEDEWFNEQWRSLFRNEDEYYD